MPPDRADARLDQRLVLEVFEDLRRGGRLLREVVRIVRILPTIESVRLQEPLHGAVGSARSLGAKRLTRSNAEREDLQRVIRLVDRFVPCGRNCVRRALLEISLDAAAAQMPFMAGFKASSGPGSGHAWLGSPGSESEMYDAVFTI